MTDRTEDKGTKGFSLLDDFDAEDALRLTVGDATLDIGLNFLKGAAMNSNITLEQKMGLQAMKAIIDNIAKQASTAQPGVVAASGVAAVSKVNSAQQLLS